MSKEINDHDWILSDPGSRKWIRQCIICQEIGISEDVPEKYFNKHWLDRGLKKIKFNELGICRNCEELRFFSKE